MMMVESRGTVGAAASRQGLATFRSDVYRCLTRRADALFELCDAVLCASGPVTSLPELTLDPVHRRGHGAMYDALAAGDIDLARLRMSLSGLPLPRISQGRLLLAVDVTPWPRPDAECSPQRCHCHRPCRCDGVRQTIPGRPYSIVAALESGPSSWTAPLDAVRLGPDDDVTEVDLALSDEERSTLVRWASRRKSAPVLALRCRIVLACADGLSNADVAEQLGFRG